LSFAKGGGNELRGQRVMVEKMRNANKTGHLSAREEYELEHLAKKYGLHARLAKAGRAPERETRSGADEHTGPVKKTGT